LRHPLATLFPYTTLFRSDGTVWAWGDNTYGQLGIGTFGGSRNSPTQVSNLSGVVAVKAGGSGHSLALKADGNVWAWGLNDDGQLDRKSTRLNSSHSQISY